MLRANANHDADHVTRREVICVAVEEGAALGQAGRLVHQEQRRAQCDGVDPAPITARATRRRGRQLKVEEAKRHAGLGQPASDGVELGR